MDKLKAVWELMRLEHGVMIFIAIMIGSIIALRGEGFPPWDNFILTFCTALFLESSTFALNDYFDLEIDRKNERFDRPLVRGDLSPKTALYLFYIFFPLGIICSFFVNYTCFFIALITGFLAILYDFKLKRLKLLGNFYIAYVMAVPFVFGGAAVLETNTLAFNIPASIFIVSLIAFLAGAGREIMKDVMDYEGDRDGGVKSFPSHIGIKNSNILASFFYIIAVVLSFIPFIVSLFSVYHRNLYYIAFIIITDVMLVLVVSQLLLNRKNDMGFYRKLSLVALFVGLIGFLIPTLMQ
ncbi:MAG: UbiA family prenyltransferase [Candidatus Thermoplasmatota archaeon]